MYNLVQRSKEMKNKKGFTLIELIVVIVIIGILAAIAIPRLAGFQESAKYKADVSMAKTIATAAIAYYSANDADAADVATLVTAGLIESNETAGATVHDAYGAPFTFTSSSGEVAVSNSDGVELWPAPATATPDGYGV